MKFDVTALSAAPSSVEESASRAESTGCDGFFLPETRHDPFVLATLAARRAPSLEVGTGIAVAFARNPMDLAYSANDLQLITEGRFLLGLGSQVKAHVERRFSMPWSRPVDRMREYIAALRAIWACWLEGAALDFRGEFYEHRLMTPFFAGVNHGFGSPRIGLAAVGPAMTALAGEVADLLFCNPLTTERFLREATIPALAEGAASADRSADDVEVSVGVFVVTGRDGEERARVEQATKQQIAFYASTPAYRSVLEIHGWNDLHDELRAMTRAGQWEAMADAVDDEMLRTFAVVVDDPDTVGAAIVERFRALASRVYLYEIWEPDAPALDAVRRALRSAG